MVNDYNGEPEVFGCIIQIREHVKDYGAIEQWDTLLLRTSVRKYYIGLSKDNIVNANEILIHYQLKWRGKFFTRKANLYHPLIRINQRGFKALKCPTIAGGSSLSYLMMLEYRCFRKYRISWGWPFCQLFPEVHYFGFF